MSWRSSKKLQAVQQGGSYLDQEGSEKVDIEEKRHTVNGPTLRNNDSEQGSWNPRHLQPQQPPLLQQTGTFASISSPVEISSNGIASHALATTIPPILVSATETPIMSARSSSSSRFDVFREPLRAEAAALAASDIREAARDCAEELIMWPLFRGVLVTELSTGASAGVEESGSLIVVRISPERMSLQWARVADLASANNAIPDRDWSVRSLSEISHISVDPITHAAFSIQFSDGTKITLAPRVNAVQQATRLADALRLISGHAVPTSSPTSDILRCLEEAQALTQLYPPKSEQMLQPPESVDFPAGLSVT